VLVGPQTWVKSEVAAETLAWERTVRFLSAQHAGEV